MQVNRKKKLSKMKEVKKDILWRVYLVYLAVLLFSFFIIGQVIHIQFAEGSHWKQRSDVQTIDTMKIEAIRGNICASDGNLLATSVPIFDIYWDSKVPTEEAFEKNIDSLSICLSGYFKDRTKEAYKKLFVKAREEQREYVLIQKSSFDEENSQITYEKLKAI